MKILKTPIDFLLCMLLVFGSCSKQEEDYTPMRASVIDNDIFLSVTDLMGKDLLKGDSFIEDFSVLGTFSKRNIPLNVENIGGTNYIRFAADLPESTKMNFSKDKSRGTGISEIYLKRKSQNIKIICVYKYESDINQKGNYGGSSIAIESILCDGDIIYRNADSSSATQLPSLALPFILDEDLLLLKKRYP